MKIILSLVMGMFVYSGLAQARDQDVAIERGLEAMAMMQLMGDPELRDAIAAEPTPRGIIDTIESIKKNLEGLKDSFLTTFDTNGNGWIDPGAETENLKTTLNDIVLLFVDTNKNGAIEPQELAALAQQLLDQVKGQIEERVCTKIIIDTQKLGDLIVFNPLLKAAYERCTDLGLAP